MLKVNVIFITFFLPLLFRFVCYVVLSNPGVSSEGHFIYLVLLSLLLSICVSVACALYAEKCVSYNSLEIFSVLRIFNQATVVHIHQLTVVVYEF